MPEIRRAVTDTLGVAEDAFASTSVCIFPHFPASQPSYTIIWMLDALGIVPKPYNPWTPFDLCICFEDRTRNVLDAADFIARSAQPWLYDERRGEWIEGVQVRRFVNARCDDISKQRVGRVFEEVFGYQLDVDPTTYTGTMVRKSDLNAAHDGAVLVGPISEVEYARHRESCVYSVHVNNVDGDLVDDLRVLWCDRVSPMLDRKRRPAATRFAPGAEVVLHEPVADHCSADEVAKLDEFCRAFGLDYGELDCLRDRDSGRLYVVDVNKTPTRPFARLPEAYAVQALTSMAVEFAKGFLVEPRRA
jgi:hypothetical protein